MLLRNSMWKPCFVCEKSPNIKEVVKLAQLVSKSLILREKCFCYLSLEFSIKSGGNSTQNPYLIYEEAPKIEEVISQKQFHCLAC